MAFAMVPDYEPIKNPGIVPKKLPPYCRQAASKGVKLKRAKRVPVASKIHRQRLYTRAMITAEDRYAMATSSDSVVEIAYAFNTTTDVVYKAKRAHKKLAQFGKIT